MLTKPVGRLENWPWYRTRNHTPNPSEPSREGLTVHRAIYAMDTTPPGLWTLPVGLGNCAGHSLAPSLIYNSFSAKQPEQSLKSANHITSLLPWLLITRG